EADAGRGWVEGRFSIGTRGKSPSPGSPLAMRSDLSPQAGRGDNLAGKRNSVESSPMSSSHDHSHAHDHHHDHADMERWKHDGVRVIPGNQLDPNVPSTPGMDRKAAINFARAGAQKLWAGTVTIRPDAKTGAHHHGHLESIIYVVKGRARMRWGEKLQFTAEAGPGDFIFVPPYVPHQEINA